MGYRRYKKKIRKTTSIYVIEVADRGKKYYYVGKSNSPHYRIKAHQDKAVRNLGNNVRKNTIFKRNLHRLRLRILEKPKMKHWRARERYWIAHYREKYGDRVLNLTDGGDGKSGGGYKDHIDKGGNLSMIEFVSTAIIVLIIVAMISVS